MKTAAKILLALLLVVGLTAGPALALTAAPEQLAERCCDQSVCAAKCCIAKTSPAGPTGQPALPAGQTSLNQDLQAALAPVLSLQLQRAAAARAGLGSRPVQFLVASPVPLFLRTHSFLI